MLNLNVFNILLCFNFFSAVGKILRLQLQKMLCGWIPPENCHSQIHVESAAMDLIWISRNVRAVRRLTSYSGGRQSQTGTGH